MMKILCGCCKGTEVLTPTAITNRPGLSAINYRAGVHASFLETMKARLSNLGLDIPTGEFDPQGRALTERRYPLQDLKTRDSSDPAIALLDAWATVADVLTFYEERIANEGYLRTATERRSVLELARLIGYKPRPGVSASVYLAYTLDERSEPVEIAAGARAQSVPGPGELPQTFETSDPLKARAEWNLLKPRMSQPQTFQSINSKKADNTHTLWLKGVNTSVKVNDRLLVVDGTARSLFRVTEVQADAPADRTRISLLPGGQTAGSGSPQSAVKPNTSSISSLLESLKVTQTPTLANSSQLKRSLEGSFAPEAENNLRLLKAFNPEWNRYLSVAWANAEVTPQPGLKVFVFRQVASLFGHNTAKRVRIPQAGGEIEPIGEWPILISDFESGFTQTEFEDTVFLDAGYDKILPGSWVVVDTSALDEGDFTNRIRRADGLQLITRAEAVNVGSSRAEYGMTGKTSRIKLANKWLKIEVPPPNQPPPIAIVPTAVAGGEEEGEAATGEELEAQAVAISQQPLVDKEFQIIRRTLVYAQSEELELAEEPVEGEICSNDDYIELDGFYGELQAGSWVILSGERIIEGTSAVQTSELAMLADVVHQVSLKPVSGTATSSQGLPGDKRHTFIKLDRSLKEAQAADLCYKRATVKIYGNVVKATHGETRTETLGSGDAGKALQQFTLKQAPLTYVSAATSEGIASTLRVRVNDVEWHESDTLAGLPPTGRNFTSRTDDDGKTSVVFGNGKQGARLPSGIENITAVYRNGIGQGGNVKEKQISLPLTKPLGVREVINPLRASGGADRENRDLIRRNAPLAVMALDHLVSTQDYADFARTFAGVGKALAARLSDGRRQIVQVTIAGVDDIAIDKTSDLYQNLRQALHKFGDAHLAIQLDVRALKALVISAKVAILRDYIWEKVEPKIRAALLASFSFDQRELAQTVFLSEAISAIQKVEGVAFADVDVLDFVNEERVIEVLESKPAPGAEPTAGKLNPYIRARAARLEEGRIKAAELAFLTPKVADTLILNQIKEVSK
jgi:hypothetical protein